MTSPINTFYKLAVKICTLLKILMFWETIMASHIFYTDNSAKYPETLKQLQMPVIS